MASPPPPKPLALFAAHALALTLLIGFWPTPRAAYPGAFHAHANALFGALESPHVRLLEPPPGSGVTTDTLLVGASHRGEPVAWRSWFSLDRLGWWPSAALVALLLATPLAPARRLGALVLGLLLLDAVALGRIGIEIAYASYESELGAGGAPTRGPLHLLLRVGSESLTASIPSAAAVLVCWAALARPRRAIAGGFAPTSPTLPVAGEGESGRGEP